MRLHQGQVIQLLHYHTKWLSSDNLSDREGQWLYALFLRLDPLVESDEVSILRSVAKKCALIRSHMTRESGSKLASVNMVITLVARVYGQADML
ncbi:gem (nuclear organelle) associated protein 2 [Actinomortierella wolfii]|nr:gem (nuclear organelle) associated protein 2 [Actinomortierella wolfii]